MTTKPTKYTMTHEQTPNQKQEPMLSEGFAFFLKSSNYTFPGPVIMLIGDNMSRDDVESL